MHTVRLDDGRKPSLSFAADVVRMRLFGKHKRQHKIGMVTILPARAITEREWNFRDDVNQNFFGDIPADQPTITLTLNWKPDAATAPRLVGRYSIDLRLLVSEGFARKSNRGVNLRFQRTGDIIEIAIDRESPALVVGRKPQL
jgi:hypothetical protein